MASHRRPKSPSRARISVLTAAAATAVALSANSGAHADPRPSKDEVKEQIDQLQEQAEVATEEFNGATERQEQLQQQVNELQDQVAQGQAELTEMQSTLGAVASAQYRTGGIDPSLQLMLSEDPEAYLDKASALDQLTAEQTESLEQIAAKKRELDQQRAEASAALEELESARATAAEKKEEIQEKLQEQQALLDQLTAEEQAALQEAERQAAAAAAAEAAEAAERASRDTGRESLNTDTGTAVDVAVSGHAAAAVAAAESALGSPYVYGASGPNSFDCSGLTSWAWRQAGVTIPRTSQGQLSGLTQVSLSEAQPGDLVIFYGDAHHVGMYVGDGMMIHAPRTGTVVRYESIHNMPINAVVRV
ncbi:NlpC/P60 family protein [Allostreptomyces psammosilenae]|uniref:Cell wall-associated NlpC family hydrolase n=1 Tax=Allostreptomyces psammosilenae TaxID=1892865 RepID=A0A853A938_9ACTN|nr:NlpC/P60 family protein [Allostreptomyces psammosilenae]NYI07038.1 cell wall-associated NlpC family hydrolase [Allostreptomyces psammosilenae]